MDPAERDLVRKAREGRPEAFTSLVERYARPVQALVRALLPARGDREDMVQETFFQAWRSLDRLRKEERFPSWLYGIARNLCRKERRRLARSREDPSLDPGTLPGREAPPGKRPETPILDVLAALPEKARRALHLRHVEGIPLAEIGRMLGLEVNGVNALLYRSRKLLRERWRRRFHEPRV